MARIPLQTAQRGLDTGPLVQYPGGSPVGAAIQQAGGALQGLALRVKEKSNQKDAFDAKLRENEFTYAVSGLEDQAIQTAPADASGLHDGVYGQIDPSGRVVKPGGFDKLFDDYLNRVPESKRAEFAAKRESYRMAGSNRLAQAQYAGEQKYYAVEIQKTQDQIINSMLAIDPNDTKTFEQFKRQGLDIIDRSGWPALQKDVARTNWEANASETLFKLKLEKDPAFAAQARGALGLGGAAKAPALPQDQAGRATVALSFFMGRGYTKEQSAGIVGNLLQESGLRPSGAVGDNGTAFGVAQWRGERLTKLKRFSAANGKDWHDFETQLAFVDTELQQDEPTAYAALKSAKTVDEATAAFIGFERPRGWSASNPRGGHGWSNRLGFAAKVAGVEVPSGASDPAFANIPPDRRLVLANQADVQVAEVQRQQVAQQKAEYASYKDSLELQIVQGKVRDGDIISSDGVLTDGDKATLLRSVQSANKDNAGVDAILSSLAGGGKVDINPFDADQTRVGEKAYDSLVAAAPPQQRQAAGESFIAQTGYVPNAVTANIRQSLSATTGQQAGQGMEQAARIFQIAPAGLDATTGGKEIRDAAIAYNELVYGRGMSRDEAGKRWADLHSPEAIERQQRLKEPAKDFLKTLAVTDVTAALDTSMLPFNTPSAGLTSDQQLAVMSDYSKIAEEKFIEAGGDPALAKQLALADMKKLYGVSEVSGSDTLMKFPPERYYPAINGEWGYIRDAAMADVKSINADAANVMLVPTKETADDVRMGNPPRYGLYYQDAAGIWNEVVGSRFAVNPEELSIRMRADQERRINEAKASRAVAIGASQGVAAEIQNGGMQNNPLMSDDPNAVNPPPEDFWRIPSKGDLQKALRLELPDRPSATQQGIADQRDHVNDLRQELKRNAVMP